MMEVNPPQTIAYFSMEMALESELPTYSRGISGVRPWFMRLRTSHERQHGGEHHYVRHIRFRSCYLECDWACSRVAVGISTQPN